MADLPNKMRFSSAESFQLVMTGLKYLRAYERNAAADSLDLATETLTRGVRKFPGDVAPRFYLGVAKTVSGARNSGEAIRIWTRLLADIEEYNSKDLKVSVKYNLACAHAGTYEPTDFTEARRLLGEVLRELPTRKTDVQTALQRQAEILLIWLDIRDIRDTRLKIRDLRQKGTKPERNEFEQFSGKLRAIEGQMEAFKRAFDQDNIGEHERNEILADYWNNHGIISWYRAEIDASENERREHGEKAIESFQQSLDYKLNWPPPRSNMAMVYHDIFKDPQKAEEIWLSILDTEPTHDFAKMNLGDLKMERAEQQTNLKEKHLYWEEAIKWYREAESRSAALRIARVLLNNLGKVAEAKSALDDLLARLDPAIPHNSSYRSEAYELLGEVHERLGKIEEAIAFYKESERPEAKKALDRLTGV
jgi:hypothetical protein